MTARPSTNIERPESRLYAQEAQAAFDAEMAENGPDGQPNLETLPGSEIPGEVQKRATDKALQKVSEDASFVEKWKKSSAEEKGRMVGKAALLTVGAGAAAWVVGKIIKGAWGLITNFKETVSNAIDSIKEASMGGITKAILTPVLGVTVVASLYKILDNRGMGPGELLEIWNKDGMKGISAFVLEGASDMGEDTYEALRKGLDKVGLTLPGFAAIGALKKGKEKAGEALGKAKEGLDGVKDKVKQGTDDGAESIKDGFRPWGEVKKNVTDSLAHSGREVTRWAKELPYQAVYVGSMLHVPAAAFKAGGFTLDAAQSLVPSSAGNAGMKLGALALCYTAFQNMKPGPDTPIPVTPEAFVETVRKHSPEVAEEQLKVVEDNAEEFTKFFKGEVSLEELIPDLDFSMEAVLSSSMVESVLKPDSLEGQIGTQNMKGLKTFAYIITEDVLPKDQRDSPKAMGLKRLVSSIAWRINHTGNPQITDEDIQVLNQALSEMESGVQLVVDGDFITYTWKGSQSGESKTFNLGFSNNLPAHRYGFLVDSFTVGDRGGARNSMDTFNVFLANVGESAQKKIDLAQDISNAPEKVKEVMKRCIEGESLGVVKDGLVYIVDGTSTYAAGSVEFVSRLIQGEPWGAANLYMAAVGNLAFFGVTKDILTKGTNALSLKGLSSRFVKSMTAPVRYSFTALNWKHKSEQYMHEANVLRKYLRHFTPVNGEKVGNLVDAHKLSASIHEKINSRSSRAWTKIMRAKLVTDIDVNHFLDTLKLTGTAEESKVRSLFSGLKQANPEKLKQLVPYLEDYISVLDKDTKILSFARVVKGLEKIGVPEGKIPDVLKSVKGSMLEVVTKAGKAVPPMIIAAMIYDNYSNSGRDSKEVLKEHMVGWALMANFKLAAYEFRKSAKSKELLKKSLKDPKAIVKYLAKVGVLTVLEGVGITMLDIEGKAEELIGAGQFNTAAWNQAREIEKDVEILAGTRMALGTKMGKKAAEKIGILISKGLEKTVVTTFIKKTITSVTKKMAVIAGTRMAVAGGAATTGVGAVVSVGLVAWTAYDCYGLAKIVKKARDVKKGFESQAGKGIKSIDIDSEGERNIAELYMAENPGERWEDLSEEDRYLVIATEFSGPKVAGCSLTIHRDDGTSEDYRFRAGKPRYVNINNKGESVELTEEDLKASETWEPPEKLELDDIPYDKFKDNPEELEGLYAMVGLQLKTQTQWSQLELDVQNHSSIILRRGDFSGDEFLLEKDASNKWTIKSKETGAVLPGKYKFDQALSVANMNLYQVKRLQELVHEKGDNNFRSEDGTTRPFVLTEDRSTFEFQKDGRFWGDVYGNDVEFMDEKWFKVYTKQLKMSPETIVNGMNTYYQSIAKKLDLLGS